MSSTDPSAPKPLKPSKPSKLPLSLAPLSTLGIAPLPTTSSKKFNGGSPPLNGGAEGSYGEVVVVVVVVAVVLSRVPMEPNKIGTLDPAGVLFFLELGTGKNGFRMYALAYPSRRWSVSSFPRTFEVGRGRWDTGGCGIVFSSFFSLYGALGYAAVSGAPADDAAATDGTGATGGTVAPAADSFPSSFRIVSSVSLATALLRSKSAASASNVTLRCKCSPSACAKTSFAN
jgi:hypothetical protein